MNTIVLTTLAILTSVALILYITTSIINLVTYFQTLKLRDETIKLAEQEASYNRLMTAGETETTKAVNDAYEEALDLLK